MGMMVHVMSHGWHGAHGDFSHVRATVGWWIRVWITGSEVSASRHGALETQLSRNPHLLETLTAITVTLILSLFGTESIVQKLLFNLGSLLLGLGQDAIDFCGWRGWTGR